MDDGQQKRAKHESGAVALEEDLSPLRPDGSRRRILTGDRTTGKLHLGHWVGSLKNRVRLQHIYETYILMADVQALTTHYDRPEILRQSVMDVALDYLAAGIDPDEATIVIQSMVPAIADLTVYYGLLVPVRSLIDNPTTKAEAEQYGFHIRAGVWPTDDPEVSDRFTDLAFALVDRFNELGHVDANALPEALKQVARSNALEVKQELNNYAAQGSWPDPDFPELKTAADWFLRDLSDFPGDALEWTESSHIMLKALRDYFIMEKRQRGFTSMSYGFLGYPVSQAADITFVNADLVPVGVDQVPLIELCREVVDRFNHQYGGRAATPGGQDQEAGKSAGPTDILRKPQALLGSTTELIRGIDGSAKMSKSQNNAIYLSDSDERVWELLRPAPTDPQRVRRTDPGRPELCNIYAYHTVFCGVKEDGIDEAAIGAVSVEEVAHNCRTAGWGCIDCKKNLALKLTALLDPMRERRAQWEAQPHRVREILLAGTERARLEGEKTLERVRSAMHMDYFS